jgi:lysophospholipase L1-like esterase
MKNSSQPVTVLCYGDSNTHGTRSDRSGRYLRSVRWTGRLQEKLGNGYYVIEEGLGGRTTNLDHPRTEKPMRNGFAYFRPCFESQSPVNIAVIMLGTNDHKNVYHRPAAETAEQLRNYCRYIRQTSPPTRILLVAPGTLVATEPVEFYDADSEQKSKELIPLITRVAQEEDINFYDANEIVKVGADGLHWPEECHEPFAAAIETIVRQMI